MLGMDQLLTTGDVDLGGIKFGLVTDNYDPLCLERVKVRVAGVHNMDDESEDNAIWACHMAPSKQFSGELPDIGDWLYVLFIDKEDPTSCCWLSLVRTIKG